MADGIGGGYTDPTAGGGFGSGLAFGGGDAAPVDAVPGADVPPAAPQAPPAADPQASGGFGSSFKSAFSSPHYTAPDPQMSALDQSADLLQQRIQRANEIATNPILQFFNPEDVQKARDFAPQAAEKLQQIRVQQAGIMAGKQQAQTLGLAPGEVPDEATQADRVEVAKAKALKGDLNTIKGLQSVDPKAAEAIQDQVYEKVGSHLTKAQFAFDKLSNMRNQGEYTAAVSSLRADGTLTDLEALGLKVPPSFDAFGAAKAKEGQALREARIGIDTVRQKLEDRNTYQPMEEKEAKTYNGRLTTAYGDQITNGTWSRNGAAGTRGLVVNGAADPRNLGKSFTLATPEQRKAVKEEFDGAVPKEDMEKYRANERTYKMATTDASGKPLPDGKINTNPNVQQGIAEGLASALRGGSGGANVGLLKIETGKRGYIQGLLDSIQSNFAGAVNTISEKEVRPYLTKMTQAQQRDVLDFLHAYNGVNISDRVAPIAQRAGALGLDSAALGLGKGETAGVIDDAIKVGRDAQIARMMPNHQAIGGGDGVLQLGAQSPGNNAAGAPPGTAPTTQMPGAAPVATPVQQAQQPQAPAPAPPAGQPPSPAGGAPPAAPNPVAPPAPGGSGPAGGGSPAPVQPLTIAGQQVNAPPMPPGVSPNYLLAMQRIESGKSKDPWTATTGKGPDGKPVSSAGGAFQMIDSTWNDNKPAGAPDHAKDATPEQQIQAASTLTTKNAAALAKSGLPVNDVNMYVSHNLGATGGTKLLTADPNADARTVVGETAARNNPLFFRGKPTVAKVLERYRTEMEKLPDEGPKPGSGSGGAAAEAPSLLTRVSRMLSQGVAGGDAAKDKAVADVGNAAVEHAPAIGSTAGAVLGSAVPVAGTVGGGAAGGAAGQSLKDYLQGRPQDPKAIAKEGVLGGVLGIIPAGRPVVGAIARTGGAAAVEGGAKAAEGGDTADVLEAAGKGGAAAAGGEMFGRALGMVGHKVWNMFAPDAKKAVQTAAAKYSEAETTLASEAPKLPGVNGAAGSVNPKYEAAEKARTEAETVLKDAGLKPEEAAYAHKVASEGVPKQEAEAARPGAIEKDKIGAGYQQMENEVGAAGVGNVKPTPKLADGPRAAVESGSVSKDHTELAERVEAAITAPAQNWQEKWVQLKEARSDLLKAERDAETSTVPGRTQTAKDMRTLADTVRKQQEKAAKYVFGEKDGEAFMARLKVLDTRYRNLMEATNGGDLAKAAVMKGDAGRDAERKFIAFAHDDPQAQAAYKAMRGARSDSFEATVPWTVAAEGLPVVGKLVKVTKIAGMLKEWARERTAGSPVKFSDLIKTDPELSNVNQSVRDLTGTAAQRGATM